MCYRYLLAAALLLPGSLRAQTGQLSYQLGNTSARTSSRATGVQESTIRSGTAL